MTSTINWEDLSKLGKLRAVIDPNDGMGFKNMLIDRVHWLAIQKQIGGAQNLLDFGCGSGRFAKRIKAMGIQYTGIDTSKGMIKAAQDWNEGDESSFVLLNGPRLPFADSSFDTVICARVFLHLLKTSEGENLINEIARVLSPNGRFVLLEEASLSQRKSGQAPCSLTEGDFISALSMKFEVKTTHKVRSSEFSKFSRKITEYPVMPYWLFRILLAPLSSYELGRAMSYGNDYYKKVTYFDFLIHARLRA